MSIALDSNVPAPIRDYFTAMNAFNSEGMIAPFTDDGWSMTSSASSGGLTRSSAGQIRKASATMW